MTNKLIILGGYARSGKTTALDYLESKQVAAFSTSRLLHDATARFLEKATRLQLQELKLILLAKNQPILGVPPRDWLIHVAESVLVPVYGRENAFVEPVVRLALAALDQQSVVVESIGGVEFELMHELFASAGVDPICLNIRSNRELADVDYRDLLPNAIEIENNGNFEEFYNALDSFLDFSEFTHVF